jgi:hypothetical protein
MTVAGALEELCVAAEALAETMSAARTTICEDQPRGGASLVLDDLADAMIELAGDADALRRRIEAVALGPEAPSRAQVLTLVTLAQRTLGEIADGVAGRVMPCRLQAEIERAARRGGPPWTQWWAAATLGLADCEPTLRALRDTLFACWRELADTAGPSIYAGVPPTEPKGHAGPTVIAAHGELSAHLTLSDTADGTRGGQKE